MSFCAVVVVVGGGGGGDGGGGGGDGCGDAWCLFILTLALLDCIPGF